jgi:hypothetical protein
VASGLLRLDYPIGGGCPAGLIEPSAQNLALQSEDFTTTWSATNISVSANSTGTLDPYGTNVADLLTATASGSARVAQSFSFVSGTTYTYSCFAKAGSNFFQMIMENGGLASGVNSIWNVGTGEFVASGTFGSGYTLQATNIENYGNGWYRCSMRVLMNVSAVGNIRVTTSNGTFNSASGNTVYVFGAQVETGAIPTSYIPTTTASATRNADVCTVSGVSGYIGQTEGTLYLDLSYEQGSSTANRWLELFGSSNNIGLAVASTNLIRSIVNGQSDSLSGTDARNRFKIAWGYDSSGVVCFINGTQFTLTNGGMQVITSLDSFRIDMSTATGQRIFNNRIRAHAIYPTRLTDDQLANITRLT